MPIPDVRLAAMLIVPALVLIACEAPGGDPPIIIVPGDMAVEPDDGSLPDAAPPPDAGPPPDAAPPPPDVGPACTNPCDDGDPGTTRDRCIDDACIGDPLTDLLVLTGDAYQGQPAPGRPTAPALRVATGPDGLDVQPMDWVVPRGHISPYPAGAWLTRTLLDLGRTVVLRADANGFIEVARTPAVRRAEVFASDDGAVVLAATVEGPVVHVDRDGAVSPLGVGLADGQGFVGRVGETLVARTLGAEPGEPWVVEAAPSASLDRGQVLAGLGLLPRDGETRVVDPAGRQTATIPVVGPLRAGGGWLAEAAGSAVIRIETWPPVAEAQPFEWADARFVDGGLLALDAEGLVWWIGLAGAVSEPIERGTLPPDTAFVAARADGVVARSAESLWWVTSGAEPRPLPLPSGEWAGALDDRILVFVAPDRLEAIDLETGEMQVTEGAFGPPAGGDGSALLIRGPDPAPLQIARLSPDGIEPLSTVWTPDARTLVDDVEWVRLGGETAAFIAEADGPLMALDVSDPAAEPVPAARLRTGERWSIGGVSADGRWVVWRAGDAVLGSLRGARTDGSHFPDGVELLRSRAYPVLMAPTGARLAVALDPRPSGGFPIIDLDRGDPSEATWVVTEGVGVSPIRWLDGGSLLVSLCAGDLDCDTWGVGRVDLIGDTPVFAPLVGSDILTPRWGSTVMVVDDQLYAVRTAGLAQYELRRIRLDGRGSWSTVDRGPAPVTLHGAADGGLVYTLGDELKHVRSGGDPLTIELPGPLAGLGPLEVDRPLTVLAEAAVVELPEGSTPCLDCRAWRIDLDGDPVPLGNGALRPLAWSPAGDVLVHGRIDGSYIAPVITDDTPGPAMPWPAPADADIRILRWME